MEVSDRVLSPVPCHAPNATYSFPQKEATSFPGSLLFPGLGLFRTPGYGTFGGKGERDS